MPDGVYYDGLVYPAQIAGPPVHEIPFTADPKPYIYRVPYWQDRNTLQEPAIGAPGPFGGFYAGLVGKFNAIGGDVVEFTREFAFVPDARDEQESFVYSFQVWATGSGGGIQEFPRLVKSRVRFDYFQTDTPEIEIELPRAPRIVNAFNILFPQNGFPLGGWPDNTEVLGEDATYKRWKGNIYERRQRFVKVPSIYSFLFEG